MSPISLEEVVVFTDIIAHTISILHTHYQATPFFYIYVLVYQNSLDRLLGTPPRSRKWIAAKDSESHGCGLLYKAGRQASWHSLTVRLNVRMGKTSDLSDFASGMIFSARHTGSSIFSQTTVSRVFREWCNKQKTQSASALWPKTSCW